MDLLDEAFVKSSGTVWNEKCDANGGHSRQTTGRRHLYKEKPPVVCLPTGPFKHEKLIDPLPPLRARPSPASSSVSIKTRTKARK